MTVRKIPGGSFFVSSGTFRTAKVPGGAFVNETNEQSIETVVINGTTSLAISSTATLLATGALLTASSLTFASTANLTDASVASPIEASINLALSTSANLANGAPTPTTVKTIIRAGQVISALSRASGVVSVTLSSNYPQDNLKEGQDIVISDVTVASGPDVTGTFPIDTVTDQQNFTYLQTGSTETGILGASPKAGGDYTSLATWNTGEKRILVLHDVANISTPGTFTDNEPLSFSPSGATAAYISNDASTMEYWAVNGTPAAGDTITGVTSSATASLNSISATNQGSEIAQVDWYNDFAINTINITISEPWYTSELCNIIVNIPTSEAHTGDLYEADGSTYTGLTFEPTTFTAIDWDSTVPCWLTFKNFAAAKDETASIGDLTFFGGSSTGPLTARIINPLTRYLSDDYNNSAIAIRGFNNATLTLINPIISGAIDTGVRIDHIGYIYSGVISETDTGIYNNGTITIKNTAILNSNTADYSAGTYTNSNNNASSDGTAPGTSVITNALTNSAFVDPLGHNFRIPIDSSLKGTGADLSSISDANTDIIGVSRSAPYDAGVFVAESNYYRNAKSSLAFSATGSLVPLDNVYGTANITVSPTANLTGKGELATAVSLAISTTGAVVGKSYLESAASLTISSAGAIAGKGSLASTSSITLDASGRVTNFILGSTVLSVSSTGQLTSTGDLAAAESISITVTGDIADTPSTKQILGQANLSFSATLITNPLENILYGEVQIISDATGEVIASSEITGKVTIV